jgi:glycosyltransferase involved in cell wall biosynthesis
MPSVSVIIPTYQRAHWVGAAVQSVLAQSYTDSEILVIDDGCTDNTREVLGQFGAQITVIHQPHKGVSAARNAGIRTARGRYVAFLDDDDLWHPDKLEKQMALLDGRPGIALVYTDMFVFDERGTLAATYLAAIPPPGQAYSFHFLYNWIPTSTVLMRRTCFDTVDLFDETLMACEDYDLWLRLREGQWRLHCLPEPLARYRVSETSLHKDQECLWTSVIRVKEQAFSRNPSLRQLAPRLLDRHFFQYYLLLARLYLDRAEGPKARAVVQRYRQARRDYRDACPTSALS